MPPFQYRELLSEREISPKQDFRDCGKDESALQARGEAGLTWQAVIPDQRLEVLL